MIPNIRCILKIESVELRKVHATLQEPRIQEEWYTNGLPYTNPIQTTEQLFDTYCLGRENIVSAHLLLSPLETAFPFFPVFSSNQYAAKHRSNMLSVLISGKLLYPSRVITKKIISIKCKYLSFKGLSSLSPE